jgi:hypothetical protein
MTFHAGHQLYDLQLQEELCNTPYKQLFTARDKADIGAVGPS